DRSVGAVGKVDAVLLRRARADVVLDGDVIRERRENAPLAPAIGVVVLHDHELRENARIEPIAYHANTGTTRGRVIGAGKGEAVDGDVRRILNVDTVAIGDGVHGIDRGAALTFEGDPRVGRAGMAN